MFLFGEKWKQNQILDFLSSNFFPESDKNISKAYGGISVFRGIGEAPSWRKQSLHGNERILGD